MAINYGTLKQSEKELIQKFYEYLEHTYQMHLLLLKALQQSDLLKTNDLIEKIQNMEKISNITHADLLDECTWMISKEQPQASHLRFVIAIINSINDLERICDYANNLSKFIKHNPNIYKSALQVVEDLESLAIITYQKIFDFFKNNDAQDTYKYGLKLQEECTNKYLNALKALRTIYAEPTDSFNHPHDSKEFVQLVLAIKNIERIVDHIMNIIEHFIYIKESNFFFSKNN
ncbi:phosphate signaling complex protein PhoU [Mycoplasmoides pirum]|uniref:phosphate signaling complex protein PhoU n=1 Tax=Mycoplasmoides pirum TaxID=2122 RepID=UPI000487F697|nr:phosphate signaling complex protein PhoU [Mycoplasmoides pirum]